ncbi:MAG: hypothetical protein II393_02285 [Cytophagales bacterium]|nr:hypothetical protein [Cytophagales bacterium]
MRNLLGKIKKIFTKTKDVPVNTVKVTHSVINEEIQEIKDLNLTEVDQLQGDIIASVAIAAMTSMGIPVSGVMKDIIAASAAYALRDFKEGCTNPEKLIVMRIINKVKEQREARAQARKNN